MELKETMSFSSTSPERHRLLWLYLNEKLIFYSKRKRKSCILRLNKLSTNCSETRKPELYNDRFTFSPLADVKADICDLPLRITNTILFFVITFLEHIPDDTKDAGIIPRTETRRNGHLQIPQDLSRATTFADDSITDQKERSEIWLIRSRPYLTRLF
jgi:hypothetical protein